MGEGTRGAGSTEGPQSAPPWPFSRAATDRAASRLTSQWAERWPACRPVGHELRRCAPDVWVRFHILPGSQRYPENEAEHVEVHRRHRALLTELLGRSSGSDALVVIVGAWLDTVGEDGGNQVCDETEIPCAYWRSVMTGDESDPRSRLDLYVAELALDDPALDTVLRLVAEGDLHEVIVSEPGLGWLYHPYDGGGDVIARTRSQRDRLAEQFAGWLPTSPSGL